MRFRPVIMKARRLARLPLPSQLRNTHPDSARPLHSASPACTGAARRVPVPVSPAACTFVLAPRRFRVPDLNHSKSKRLRSGTLHLCSASKQTTGKTNTETHWGNPEPPPPPENHGPGSRFPQTPSCLHPKSNDGPRRANGRGIALHRPPIPRRACRTRNLQGNRGNPGPPKARFPGSPGPPPALPPAQGRTTRAVTDSHTAPTPPTRN
jgi:hypothetical protein